MVRTVVPRGVTRLGDGRTQVDWGGPHVYQLRVAVVDGRPACLELLIKPAEGRGGVLRRPHTVNDVVISPEALHRVPIGRLVRAAAATRRLDLAEVAKELHVPPGEEKSAEVAKVVLTALAQGRGARRAVVKRWQVELPTADKWIRRAKDLGYLPGDLRRRALRGPE